MRCWPTAALTGRTSTMMTSGSRPTRRLVLAGLAGVGLMPGAALAGERLRLSGRAFGTDWHVVTPGLTDPRATARRIAATLAQVDRAMSPFRPDSEITRFNTLMPAMQVSPDFARVAGAALATAQASGGAFDPTVGPAVHRYGFGPITGPERADWRRIACEGDRLTREGAVTLDLCGIAKGYAADRIADLLRAETGDFLIEIGGEIRAEGLAADGGWPIGIADPLAGGVHDRIRLREGAVATSGDAVNRIDMGGRRYSHTIDPATRAPVRGDIASVSVIAETAMRADALATALWVMGEERGLDFAQAQGVGVLYLIRDAGGLRAASNAAFAAHLA
ncbi:FAD:protein FMN transferase [Sinirhodobacter populi]|uniref:FAD:protein FMN transferase n=2 Tax=Paenirhodobacter populi TaxID=2306993 RepID=A0A443JKS9_9RHOB|nr:FAD:protein FMN transferase [Sinirhodobacter populi]